MCDLVNLIRTINNKKYFLNEMYVSRKSMWTHVIIQHY